MIESNGVDAEGIYRVSGKQTDIADVRLAIECDADFLTNTTPDVHVLASIVKQYFRELPEPLFLFPTKDRLEYSLIQEEKERITRLKARVKALPKSNQTLLKIMVNHLTLITLHASTNKMTVSNLSLLFLPCLFLAMDPKAMQQKLVSLKQDIVTLY